MPSVHKPHTFDARGFETTRNVRGFMHRLNEISQAFIEFAPKSPGLVVDIGAAYGIATIPVINQDIKVVACDMDEAHLSELKKRVEPNLMEYLELKHGHFPQEIDFDKESVGSILLSHILHFLSPDELDQSFQKLSRWLIPKGKVFIVCYSPYIACFKRFIPVYEKRLAQGKRWPSWVENNVQDYLDAPQDVMDNLPATMNYLDLPLITKALEENGFFIEEASYLDPVRNNILDILILDGREWTGVIAVKQ